MNDRPVGVSILAVLHVIGGVLLVAANVYFLANFARASEQMSAVGIPPSLAAFGVVLLAGITLASGIGMWLGTRWGWWCATFYYVYGMARNAEGLLLVSSMADAFDHGSRGPGYYYARFGSRIVVHCLLLLYFFRYNVVEYFGMSDLHKGKAVALLVAGTVAIFAFSASIAWLAG